MNLHHLANNGKKPFIKKFFFGLYNDDTSAFSVPAAVQEGSDSKSSTGNNPDELHTGRHPKINSLENKLIRLFDRVGRPHLHDFTSGNICVFGDDEWEVESCSIQLLSRFAGIQHVVEVVDAKKVSIKMLQESGASGVPLLIKASGQIPPKLLKAIIQACRTICVLKPKHNRIVCGLAASVESSLYTRELINHLEGDTVLRGLLIASLAEDEFLLIENPFIDQQGSQAVRCFQTIISQSDELPEARQRVVTKKESKVALVRCLGDSPKILKQIEGGPPLSLQELIMGMLAGDMAVFVMDICGSFKNICRAAGGETIRLSKVFQPVSESFARCDKVLTEFEFEELLDDQAFMIRALQNLLLLITIQFTTGKRRGRFVLIVNSLQLMTNLPDSFLDSFEVVLKAAGGSLIFCDESDKNGKL